MNELQKQIDSLNQDLKKINDCETQIQTLQNDYNEYLNIKDIKREYTRKFKLKTLIAFSNFNPPLET